MRQSKYKTKAQLVAELEAGELEWQQAKVALRASEERYRSLLEASPDVITVADLTGKILMCNQQAALAHGHDSAEQLIGTSAWALLAPEELPRAREELERILEIGLIRNLEYTMIRKDGTRYPAELSAATIRDADGRPIGFMGISHDIAERKRAEGTLRESEDKYRNFVEQSSEGLALVDEQGNLVEWNQAQERIFGLKRSEVIGQPSWDVQFRVMPPEHRLPERREYFRGIVLDALQTGHIPLSGRPPEAAICTPDGSTKAISQSTFLIKTEHGNRLGIVTRDITEEVQTKTELERHRRHLEELVLERTAELRAANEQLQREIADRKRAEVALHESHENIQALLNAPTDSVLIINAEGTVLASNQVAAQRLGRTVEEMQGRSVYDFLPPEVSQSRRMQAEQAIRRRAPVRFEDRRGERYFDQSVYPVVGARGDVVRLVIIARDVSDHKEAEQALRESEERYRSLVEASPDSVALTDLAGRVLACNRQAAILFGYENPEQIVGANGFEFFSPDELPRAREQMRKLVQHGVIRNYEHTIIKRDGAHVPVEVNAALIRGADGAPRAFMGITRDITERQRSAEELERLYEQMQHDHQIKSKLLKEINHRVKNSLISIIGLLMAEESYTPLEGRRFVETAIHNITARIEGLLEVHTMLSDSQWAPICVSDLARRIIGTVVGASPSDQRVTVDVAPCSIEVSPRQANHLALVFNELATNTVRHAWPKRKRAHIAVRADMEGDLICIEYRDNGPGYPEEVIRLEHHGVGIYLLKDLLAQSLRGTLTLANDGGAVAILRIKTEEKDRT